LKTKIYRNTKEILRIISIKKEDLLILKFHNLLQGQY